MALIRKSNLEDESYLSIQFFLYFIAYKQSRSIVEVVKWLLDENYQQTVNTYEKDKENGGYITSDDLYVANNHILKRIFDCGLINFLLDDESEERRCVKNLHYKIDALNRNRILKQLNLNFYQVSDFSYTHNPDDTVTSTTESENNVINQVINDYKELIEKSELVINQLKDRIVQQEKEMSEVIARQGYLDRSNEYFSVEMKLCHDTWNHCYNNGEVSSKSNAEQVRNYLSTYPDFKVTSNVTKRVETVVNPKKKLIAGK